MENKHTSLSQSNSIHAANFLNFFSHVLRLTPEESDALSPSATQDGGDGLGHHFKSCVSVCLLCLVLPKGADAPSRSISHQVWLSQQQQEQQKQSRLEEEEAPSAPAKAPACGEGTGGGAVQHQTTASAFGCYTHRWCCSGSNKRKPIPAICKQTQYQNIAAWLSC